MKMNQRSMDKGISIEGGKKFLREEKSLNKGSEKDIEELEAFFTPIAKRFPSLGKAFKTSTSYYFYDAGTGKVLQCGDKIFKILKQWEASCDFKSILNNFEIPLNDLIEELLELKSAVDKENIMQAKLIEHFYLPENVDNYISTHVNMITLELTERCNLRCKYCIYQDFNEGYRGYGERDMTIETARHAIDLLVKHSADVEPEKKLIVTFYGGEPLLKFDLIKQCVEYAESKKVDHEWLFAITTNCTMLTDEKIQYFAEKGFTLTASIDGYKEIHDANRVYPNGDGSFEIALKNLEKLAIEYKKRDVEGPHISINSVITPPYDFEKLNKLQKFYSSLKWLPKDARITWAYAQPDPNKTKEETEREMARIKIGDEMELNPISAWHYDNMSSIERELFTREGEMRSLMGIHERHIVNAPITFAPLNACCIPGSRRIYVTVDGKLKVCERIGESPDIGNVIEGLDFEAIRRYFYDEYIEKSLPSCKDCWTVQMCALCYMYCYNKDGIDMDRKRLSCERIKFLNERSLVRYHELLENNPQGLKNLLNLEYN